MKKYYEGPEIQIRNYSLPARDVVMTSDPNVNQETGGKDTGLEDGDNYGYF